MYIRIFVLLTISCSPAEWMSTMATDNVFVSWMTSRWFFVRPVPSLPFSSTKSRFMNLSPALRSVILECHVRITLCRAYVSFVLRATSRVMTTRWLTGWVASLPAEKRLQFCMCRDNNNDGDIFNEEEDMARDAMNELNWRWLNDCCQALHCTCTW